MLTKPQTQHICETIGYDLCEIRNVPLENNTCGKKCYKIT